MLSFEVPTLQSPIRSLNYVSLSCSSWLRGRHKHPTENKDLRVWVKSPTAHASNTVQPQIAKKINKAPLFRVIVVCSDHRFLWSDSYKSVYPALQWNESTLHKIIIIIKVFVFKVNLPVSVLAKDSCLMANSVSRIREDFSSKSAAWSSSLDENSLSSSSSPSSSKTLISSLEQKSSS